MNSLMTEIKKTMIVSKYTFLEVIKSKIVLVVFILGMVLAFATYVASVFTYGVPSRVALDFGLGLLSLSSIGIAIFMGSGLIANEIESRTIYMVLSRSISRKSFLIGRMFGMSAVLVLNTIILGILSLAIFFWMGGKFSPIIFWAFLFTIIEAVLVLSLVIFFSLITNTILTVVFSLSVFVAGHAIYEVKVLFLKNASKLTELVINFFSLILPNFNKLNIKDFVIYKQSLSLGYLTSSFAYGMIYILFLMFLSTYIFEKKNLD